MCVCVCVCVCVRARACTHISTSKAMSKSLISPILTTRNPSLVNQALYPWSGTTNQAKATVLNYHFSSVFTHDEEATLPEMGPSPYPSLPDIEINIAWVTNLLKEVNP